MNQTYKLPVVVLSLTVLLVIVLLPCQARAGHTGNDKKQFEFAEQLFTDKDFNRAITEYKRFIFLFPDNNLCEKSYYRICESYFKAERWEEAIESLEHFESKFPHSSMLNDAVYLKGMSEKNLKRYDEAISSFKSIIASCSEPLRNKAFYQVALIYVDTEEWGKAREYFLKVSDQNTLYPSAWLFSSGLENIGNLPHKSPALAGTFAAIIPGAGHLYTERPQDALIAFLLNGAFIWAAVELFNDDNYVAGGVVTFFELGWYSGNIYSAVSSAHKYNRRVKREFIQNLKDRCNISYFFDNDNSRHFLMVSMKF
ncbi:MAG: tetratricopeptide repeat protein [Syntrophobacterales bacterium]|nr:tetratricopeptide repeat protein [Syntrophobacterales bacterium]